MDPGWEFTPCEITESSAGVVLLLALRCNDLGRITLIYAITMDVPIRMKDDLTWFFFTYIPSGFLYIDGFFYVRNKAQTAVLVYLRRDSLMPVNEFLMLIDFMCITEF
jgi:hypothetical protein